MRPSRRTPEHRGSRRRLCVALLALFGVGALPLPAVPAAAPDPLDELMALLAQRRHGEADFEETKYLAVLDQPLKSSGVLIYDAPDHLEQRVLQPRRESVVLDHGILSMRVGKRTRSVPLSAHPQLAPLVDSVRALLAGDRAALEQRFVLHFSGTLSAWQLQLQPSERRAAGGITEIDVTGARDAIREVRLQQRNGDHSVMLIHPRA